MGLDSYAYLCKKKREVDKDLYIGQGELSGLDELKVDYIVVDEEFDYWRKYYSIHKFMQDVAHRKGKMQANDFNCVCLRLSLEDIKDLESDVKHDRLDYSWDLWDKKDEKKHILTFCSLAKAAFKKGYDIFYDSSW